jgi:NRPS condensation-like uncharacterized protein
VAQYRRNGTAASRQEESIGAILICEDCASVRRVPVQEADELFVRLNRPEEPWTVHVELRVGGRFDVERLASAVRTASALHPMARARLGAHSAEGVRFWEIPEHLGRLPLQVFDCGNDRELENARERLLGVSPPLDTGPPFVLALAHHPGGDALILNLHHAAGDAIGALRLLVSIIRAYDGVADALWDADALAARDLRRLAGSRRLGDRLRRVRVLAGQLAESRTPAARLVPLGGRVEAEGWGSHLLQFDPEETSELLHRRCPPATVNDLLLAALAVGARRWNDAHGVAPARIALTAPVNLRPKEWSSEVIANLATTISVSVPPERQGDLDITQLAIAQRTARLKRQRFVDMIALGGVLPSGLKRVLRPRRRQAGDRPAIDSTAVLSNLGRCDDVVGLGGDAGGVTALWFSPPVRMPVGVSIGTVSSGDKLFITFRYGRGLFDEVGIAQFAAGFRQVLLGS